MSRFGIFFLGFTIVLVVVTACLADVYDVTDPPYNATGNGSTLDTDAINDAIQDAHDDSGGTVYFPAGTYLSGSIRLKSNVTLDLHANATILAASNSLGVYDVPDDNPWEQYAGFGHSYWKNSLIWAKYQENIAITGSGMIDGDGQLSAGSCSDGQANKTLGLRSCNGVLIRDVTFHHCGHFALKITGCNDVDVENVKVDTNRDGISFDCCNDVNIIDSYINSPKDDAITLKSNYSMGYARECNNVNISGCMVMGYKVGTFLDGTKQYDPATQRCGRIKFGTESCGGFKNVTITNCNFEGCLGFMLGCVDGGTMENIYINNITMDPIFHPPICIRLGDREGRHPGNWPPSTIRNVNISNITARNYGAIKYCSSISGIPTACIEDVNLTNISITYQGGGTSVDAQVELSELEGGYPEATMFGSPYPAYGFYVRHVNGIQFHNVDVDFYNDDERPALIFIDVNNLELDDFEAERSAGNESPITFDDVDNVNIHDCTSFPPTTANYGQVELSKDRVTIGEHFDTNIPATAASSGVCTVDMDVDSSLFDTEYIWLNAAVQKEVVFSDVQLYTLGLRHIEISDSNILQAVCMKEDFNLDFIVDYCDLDVMGQDWLQTAQIAAPEYDPVAHWKFDDGTGSTALDSSVNNNHGTLYNLDESDWVTGKFGGALEFGGSNNYVLVSDYPSTDFGSGSFSICVWMKTTEGGVQMMLIKGTSNYLAGVKSGKRYSIRQKGSDGSVRLVVDDNLTKSLADASGGINDGEWHHIVGIRDKTGSRTKPLNVYIDGVHNGNGSDGTGNINTTYDEPLYIGKDSEGSDYVNGVLDDIRLYAYALTDEEIQTLLDEVYLPFPANIYEDGTGIVDLKDYATFAQKWLIDVQ